MCDFDCKMEKKTIKHSKISINKCEQAIKEYYADERIKKTLEFTNIELQNIIICLKLEKKHIENMLKNDEMCNQINQNQWLKDIDILIDKVYKICAFRSKYK